MLLINSNFSFVSPLSSDGLSTGLYYQRNLRRIRSSRSSNRERTNNSFDSLDVENISDIKKHAIDCYYFRINNLISLEYIYIPYLFRRKSSLLLSSHKLGRIQQQSGSRRPMEAHHRSHHKSEHVTTVTLYNWIEFTSVQSHQKFTLARWTPFRARRATGVDIQISRMNSS